MYSNNAGKEILDFLANTCFWGEICCLDERGRYLPKPRSVGFKMEVMMETILEQRRWYVNDLARKHDPRVPARNPESVLNSLTFTDDDMKDLMNAWRLDVRSWMNPEQFEHYYSSQGDGNRWAKALSVFICSTSPDANSCCAAWSLCRSCRYTVLHGLDSIPSLSSRRSCSNSRENGMTTKIRPSTKKRYEDRNKAIRLA